MSLNGGMTLDEYMAATGLKDQELADELSYDRSYITHIRLDPSRLGKPAALRIWNRRRVKLGPLAGMSDEEVNLLARLMGEAA